MPEITLQQAIEKLSEELAKDTSQGSYYYSWQANIAMCFLDESRLFQDKDTNINPSDLPELANEAAKRFLDLLIKQP